MEIEIHFPLDCGKKGERVIHAYPQKATNMMGDVWERVGRRENCKFSFVSQRKEAPFRIRVLLHQGESLEEIKNILRDLTNIYEIEFFVPA